MDEEWRERDGREDLDELERISKISSSDSSCGMSEGSSTAMTCSTKVLKLIWRLLFAECCSFGGVPPSMGVVLSEMGILGGDRFRIPPRDLTMFVSDFVWWSCGRSRSMASVSSPPSVASKMGEEGVWMVSISERVRCFKMGFFTPGSRLNLSSAVATLSGRTGSTAAVWRGP